MTSTALPKQSIKLLNYIGELSKAELKSTYSAVQLSPSIAGTIKSPPMRANLRELYNYRELLVMIAARDIKVRYKQSVMGFFWAVLMPGLIVASGVLVRYGYAIASHKRLDVADLISVATKSIPWAFLVSAIKFSSQSLIGNQKKSSQSRRSCRSCSTCWLPVLFWQPCSFLSDSVSAHSYCGPCHC
jgi:hypothetical protein